LLHYGRIPYWQEIHAIAKVTTDPAVRAILGRAGLHTLARVVLLIPAQAGLATLALVALNTVGRAALNMVGQVALHTLAPVVLLIPAQVGLATVAQAARVTLALEAQEKTVLIFVSRVFSLSKIFHA
jgi:hypothetical protein